MQRQSCKDYAERYIVRGWFGEICSSTVLMNSVRISAPTLRICNRRAHQHLPPLFKRLECCRGICGILYERAMRDRGLVVFDE